MKKLLLVLLALIMIVAAIGAITIGAGAEAAAPQMNIAYCNLSFSDNVYIKYAVRSNVSDLKILIWTSPESEYVIGTQDDEITEYYTENIGGVPHMIFDYTALSAKQMADVVYARAYAQVDGVDYYSDVNKYSILQYAYSKLGKTGTASTNAELKNMLSSMLTYGASAQKYFDYKENRLATADWYQIKITAGTLDNGGTHGLYLPGDKVTITAPAMNAGGMEFACWKDSSGKEVSTSSSFEVTVGTKNEIYTPEYGHAHTAGGVVVENNVEPDCINTGSYDNVVYCIYCGEELGRETVTVAALGHSYEDGICTGCGAAGNKMPMQTYEPDRHVANDDILCDAMEHYIANDGDSRDNLLATGLPSLGEYNALVIPVQFTDDKFSNQELADLEIAFNGTQDETGWHSVSSYYRASSFGKLNLGFDIVSPVTMPQNSSYYETASSGPRNILDFALSAIDASVDLSDYDTNNDGYIDAVYLIYSVKMDRENDESNYWAFVTWRYSSPKYDGVKAHFYLFASVDFMYEDVEGSGSKYELDGLNINAVTYIHETAHLLGLDDYYDYNEGKGSDEGLGGADMMDYNVGDHNVYSKLMLGWVTPTVVTSTQEITISSSTESGEFIMILLDYDGTYFSEYLLIDLYTATGINKLHSDREHSLLYFDDSTEYKYGAEYGARIYHVSSSINNPYSDDYFSFTDNNNSLTNNPLIKLVEADGDKNFESDIYNGAKYASASDLWQTGYSLSSIQPGYTRNDGKEINFDVTFISVSADGATIQITFE